MSINKEHFDQLVSDNFNMKHKLKELKESASKITGTLFRIGGPFNDNVDKFSKEQLTTLKPIVEEAEYMVDLLKCDCSDD